MKKFEITKEQILEVASWGNRQDLVKLREWFSQAFESELELNRWIKNDSQPNWLMYRDGNNIYGFDANGAWFYRNNESYSIQSQDRYATDKEVETALIAEAKRIGYRNGVTFKSLDYNFKNVKIIDDFFNFDFNNNDLYLKVNAPLGQRYRSVFLKGKWAEILSEPIEVTLEEIAEKFNVNVEQLKIKK